MSLNIYPNIYSSGVVPEGWLPIRGGTIKYPVRNKVVLQELQRLKAGRWKKVIKQGNSGEVHYFEHSSGNVVGFKFYSGK